MDISKNYHKIISVLPKDVTLIAVSKTKPKNLIEKVYELGQRDFGENRAAELKDKAETLPSDIKWHMIGHLQRNKVSDIIGYTELIHSADSDRLLKEINKEAKKIDKVQKVLLQVKIAKEDSKYGFSISEIRSKLEENFFNEFKNIQIVGLMGMATFTDNRVQISNEFQKLHDLYNSFSVQYNWKFLSMGMSGDYQIAIDNGSNMIRVGSAIFGELND